MPRTVIEAMASRIPVVASDLEQVESVIERAGVAVPVGDVEGFAAGLEQVLDGDHGDPRSVAEEGFDWAETVERTTAVLAGLRSQ
jgi:glycosyltransferase involved in cell wall biosynthesis